MEAKWIHKIVKVGTSFAVIIPPTVLATLGLGRGEAVVIEVLNSDTLTIKPLSSFLNALPQKDRRAAIVKLDVKSHSKSK